MNDKNDKTDVQNKDINIEMETLLLIGAVNSGFGMTPGMPETSGVILPLLISNSDKDKDKQAK